MKLAILVDELPASSAPKIVGEEAFHLTELRVKYDVYVLKHRVSEMSSELVIYNCENELKELIKILLRE